MRKLKSTREKPKPATKFIGVKVTDEELKQCKQLAKRYCAGNVSELIRIIVATEAHRAHRELRGKK